MNKLFPILLAAAIGGIFIPQPAVPQIPPPAKRTKQVQISQGPELEAAWETSAIIRWTSNNPGGSDEHYGIVHYGTDPTNLNEKARSHIRLNQAHDSTVFRVRVINLKPGTTYYYTVGTEEADGTDDGLKSTVAKFATEGGQQQGSR